MDELTILRQSPMLKGKFILICTETGSPLEFRGRVLQWENWSEANERAELYSKQYEVEFKVERL